MFETKTYLRKRRIVSLKILKPTLRLIYNKRYKHLADQDKLLFIKIDDISGWYRGKIFEEYTFPGVIKGGNWKNKISTKPLQESLLYKSIHQRFDHNFDWEKTVVFKNKYIPSLKEGNTVRGYSNVDKLISFYNTEIDNLYKSIKSNGIETDFHNNLSCKLFIHINANGEILWTRDGNHRLAIAHILGIKKIPVRVWMRHKKWQLKREQIFQTYIEYPDKIPSNIIDHPDIKSELTVAFKNTGS